MTPIMLDPESKLEKHGGVIRKLIDVARKVG